MAVENKFFQSFKLFILFFLLFFAGKSVAATYVAVLETVSPIGILDRSEKAFLTDKLRERANAVLPNNKGYVIMTRENINVMLPPGSSIEECEGSCLVETGKNIAADYVAQARIGKFGSQLSLTVELYETAGGNFVGIISAHKPDVEGILDEIEKRADSLFVKILGRKKTSVRDAKKGNEEKILIDKRDGKRYKITKIGGQIWMAENLNFIPKDGWIKKKSWCYFDDPKECDKKGRLYSWKISKEVCPSGWHLPSVAEFEEMIYATGGKSAAGRNLKAKEGWHKDLFKNTNGIDKFGFSVYPGGRRLDNGLSYVYNAGNMCAFFWTSTEQDFGNAFGLVLCEDDEVTQNIMGKRNGYSVRCIKNGEE